MTITPGAALAAMRPDRRLVCAWCGQAFTAKDARARFCSNRCRQADKYARAKAAKESRKLAGSESRDGKAYDATGAQGFAPEHIKDWAGTPIDPRHGWQ